MNNGFVGLLRNELMKIYRRPRTWILLGVMVIAIIVTAVITQQVAPDDESDGWRQLAEAEVQDNEKTLKNIEDVPAPFRALSQGQAEEKVMELRYHLDHNINPYEQNSWTFMEGSAAQAVPLIAMFVIIVACDMVAGDFTSGSIKMLMVRPHHRFSILLSKYTAAAIYTFVMLVLLFFVYWLIGNFFFGFGGLTEPSINVKNGQIIEQTASVYALQVIGLEFIGLIVLMTLAFMLATLFRSNVLSIGVGIFMVYVVNLDMMFAQVEWTKYLFITNLDLAYFLSHAEGKIAGTTFTFSLLIAAAYWLVFMIVTWWTFQKRDITT